MDVATLPMMMMMTMMMLVVMMMGLFSVASGFEEVPKFEQLTLLYPGYHLYGGKYRDVDIAVMIGHNDPTTAHKLDTLHNTASLRLSIALNRYGGRHALPREAVLLSNHGRDSLTGNDGLEYIFRNTAFGPYLASKYGNPEYVKANKATSDTDSHFDFGENSKNSLNFSQDSNNNKNTKNSDSDSNSNNQKALTLSDSSNTFVDVGLLSKFRQRQGIMRMVNYNHHHAAGHVGLWDCDHFVQSRDWSHDSQLIGIEFWEAADSYCPSPNTVTPNTASVTLDMSQVQIVARHNIPVSSDSQPMGGRKHRRHHHGGRQEPQSQGTIWLQ